jgi:hypothetical protein
MKIPDKLYNPELRDQSLDSYIESFEDAYNLINLGLTFDYNLPGLNRQDMIDGALLTLRLEILFRMCKILEDHCENIPIMSVIDQANHPGSSN